MDGMCLPQNKLLFCKLETTDIQFDRHAHMNLWSKTLRCFILKFLEFVVELCIISDQYVRKPDWPWCRLPFPKKSSYCYCSLLKFVTSSDAVDFSFLLQMLLRQNFLLNNVEKSFRCSTLKKLWFSISASLHAFFKIQNSKAKFKFQILCSCFRFHKVLVMLVRSPFSVSARGR